MISTLAGLTAGVLHVLSGPDHLAAIGPIALQRSRRAWLVGLWWGIGHSSGVWLVGLAALVAREVLPIDAMSSWSERLVGVVLIGIGLWGLRKATSNRLHTHEHTHGDHRHTHVHVHATAGAHEHPAAHRHSHAALAVGTLHGLAGSSHFLGILPALALPTNLAAMTYVTAFGLGTIAAMTAFAWTIGLAAKFTSAFASTYRLCLVACACLSIVVGVFWLVT